MLEIRAQAVHECGARDSQQPAQHVGQEGEEAPGRIEMCSVSRRRISGYPGRTEQKVFPKGISDQLSRMLLSPVRLGWKTDQEIL